MKRNRRWGVCVALAATALTAGCAVTGPELFSGYTDDPEAGYIRALTYLGDGREGGYAAAGVVALNVSELSVGRIDLGRKLFTDSRLSADGQTSCATCHNPSEAYTQTDRRIPMRAELGPLPRNAPSLLDIGLRRSLFRDGRTESLEQQAVSPLLAAHEMGNASLEDVAARVRGLEDYTRFFEYAYGRPADADAVLHALAAYQTTLLTGPSRFDRWRDGDAEALTPIEVAGFDLFVGRGGCATCHAIAPPARDAAAALSDEGFRDNGYARGLAVDLGRGATTGRPEDAYRFRTPSLRNVALTAPYMHDGGLARLEDVVAFYSAQRSLALNADEQNALVALLRAFTSEERP